MALQTQDHGTRSSQRIWPSKAPEDYRIDANLFNRRPRSTRERQALDVEFSGIVGVSIPQLCAEVDGSLAESDYFMGLILANTVHDDPGAYDPTDELDWLIAEQAADDHTWVSPDKVATASGARSWSDDRLRYGDDDDEELFPRRDSWLGRPEDIGLPPRSRCLGHGPEVEFDPHADLEELALAGFIVRDRP